ncbi:Nucleoid-associated protein YgaU, contains BON and LysM domains [Aliiroseovarius halocynthiae]|nr:LysM peptidoglycan-binding domain-containing protein [Aliiroseovarius halocynthiae]SMR72887.1 Nucleoid-associated protein YgaU, contains BON and LysM domains [Aliiroseovarius halocynthiae]
MTDETHSAAGAGKIWIGIGAAVIAAVLGYLTLGTRDQAKGPVPVADIPTAVAPHEQASDDSSASTDAQPDILADTIETEAPASAPESAEDEAPEVAPTPSAIVPSFDVVRVDPDGNTVIAGQAAPGSTVQLFLNGAPVETVEVDGAGNFVAFLDLPVSSSGQLSLLGLNEAGEVIAELAEASTVLIEPSTAAPSAENEATDAVTAEVASEGPDAPADPANGAEVTEDTQPSLQTPRVLLADDEGITVLQDGFSSVAVQNVIIDSIAYDEQGEVALSGRASGGGALRVYLDNAPIKTAPIPQNGQWRLPLPDVASGVYTLRVDELAADGTVTSRTETPFKREDVAQIAAATAQSGTGAQVEAVTVQPGSTLWAIARDTLGDGPLYVRVFDANRNQITDPDLIYPGQVFTIPN